jgi:hypothetical protein
MDLRCSKVSVSKPFRSFATLFGTALAATRNICPLESAVCNRLTNH